MPPRASESMRGFEHRLRIYALTSNSPRFGRMAPMPILIVHTARKISSQEPVTLVTSLHSTQVHPMQRPRPTLLKYRSRCRWTLREWAALGADSVGIHSAVLCGRPQRSLRVSWELPDP